MNTLFIDTSTSYLSISIFSNKLKICGLKIFLKNRFNEELLVILDNVLSSLRMPLDDIDDFIVVVGPGSFTGLRIGIATVLGFSIGLSKPLYGITSLDAAALALNLNKGLEKFKIAKKLRMNEYGLRYYDFKLNRFSDYELIDKDDLEDVLILDTMNLDVTDSFLHNKFRDFLRDYEPFYMKKSQAEINFDKACRV